jgi:DNA helicase-2/ATP-dependent DNA helicase PcrA
MSSDLLNSLNDEQKRVVLHDKGPSLIIAGPGSGKTRALTHKIAYLIEKKNFHPDEILAVTFTNKAANEMKERVTALLKGLSWAEEKVGFEGAKLEKIRAPTWI